MASVINRPGGHRWIQFVDPSSKRQTLRLGKTPAKVASEVCRRVELLLTGRITGSPPDRETAVWLTSLDNVLRSKLAAVGLADAPPDRLRLAEFLDSYIASRKDLKAATLTVLGHTRRCLVEHFGEQRSLRDITPGDAAAWRIWLATVANIRDSAKDELSENTVRRRSGIAKQFFRAAVQQKLIDANPFDGLAAQVRGNRARQQFITRGEIQAAIDAAPDGQWRTIIALARYGGLRVPSELLALKWTDVDLPAGHITVRASKTEHHDSGGVRVCPIFPELRPYLEAAWDAAEPGAVYVIDRYRDTNANLRTQFLRILAHAGLKPWPKLFHNLRASRQTELLDCFPIKAVCDWLGNSQPVAIEHYAQVTAEHFLTATTVKTGEAESEAVAKQNPKQQAAASVGTPSCAMQDSLENDGVLLGSAAVCETMLSRGVGGIGLEPTTSTMSTLRSNQLS